MKKNRRGRPRKLGDIISSACFGRAVEVVAAYDKARSSGDKYAAAISEAVAQVRKRKPGTRISRSTVKREIKALWPKGSEHVLRFEETLPTPAEASHRAWVRKEIAKWRQREALELGVPIPESWIPKPAGRVFFIRVDKRPVYPRHNCKIASQ